MAVFYGRSGAEVNLITLAEKHGFNVNVLEDFDELVEEMKQGFSDAKEKERVAVNVEISDLSERASSLKETIRDKIPGIEEDVNRERRSLIKEIDDLTVKFNLRSIFRYTTATVKRLWKIRRYNYLKDPAREIRKRLQKEYNDLKNTEKRTRYLKEHFNEEVDLRLEGLRKRLEVVLMVKGSREYAGAVGEVRVVKNLARLPDEYHVINDCNLCLETWAGLDGKPIRTAQIDHLVVGPTGVFVIETKNWSKETVENAFQSGYTPYHQVRKARRITYLTLNPGRYGNYLQRLHYRAGKKEIKINSIIAICGAEIPNGKKRHTRVLIPEEIPKHIQRNNILLTDERINWAVKNCVEV